MADERTKIETALVQMLENFRRCGVTRFASLSSSELPEGLLGRVAALHQTPVAMDAVRTTPQPLLQRVPAQRGPVEQGALEPVPSLVNPTTRVQASNSPAALLPLSTGGSITELWSLPVLSSDQRQQRFDALSSQVCDCRKCAAIVGFRQQTVFGDGPLQPLVCFMGEAPGADEDRTGKPFVGKAGQLLTKIIAAMKLRREDVYILNALKCRPPQNRTPVNDEIDNCRPYVEEQLDVLQPRFIVCLGSVAVRSILRSESSIGRLRGQFHQYRGARVVVTYHPSYLLRNESAKKLVWDDMKMLMAELQSLQTS